MPSSDPYAERRRLTFEQAEGAAPLPSQLQLKELSQELRVCLWLVIEDSIGFDAEYDSMDNDWRSIFCNNHLFREHKMLDELPDNRTLYNNLRSTISTGDYLSVFGFLQHVLRGPDLPYFFGPRLT